MEGARGRKGALSPAPRISQAQSAGATFFPRPIPLVLGLRLEESVLHEAEEPSPREDEVVQEGYA